MVDYVGEALPVSPSSVSQGLTFSRSPGMANNPWRIGQLQHGDLLGDSDSVTNMPTEMGGAPLARHEGY